MKVRVKMMSFKRDPKSPDLICDFDVDARLEVFVNGEWSEVVPWIFRASSGVRKRERLRVRRRIAPISRESARPKV